MRLDLYDNRTFQRGAGRWREALWVSVGNFFMSSWLPGSGWRVGLLRAFGASIGEGVVIKPSVCIKFPWRLVVGRYCWIGERAWIDNLATVNLGDHVCVSQGAYFCTGSHDWSVTTFDLVVRTIQVSPHAWIAAGSVVGPGVTVGEGAVLGLGAVASRDLDAWTVYGGNPAIKIRMRQLKA